MLRSWIHTVVAVIACGGVPAAGGEPAISLEPFEGLVLLETGGVLEGKITRTGDHYYVAVEGGQLRIPAARVDLVCRDLDDAYRRQRDRIDPRNLRGRLGLVRWCLRHELVGYAARELSAAMKTDPKHPAVLEVERELNLALERPEPGGAETTSPFQGPRTAELDALVESLPDATVETFTSVIQPLLTNKCTVSGCHGPFGSAKFQLLRPATGRQFSRRLTQRNLHAVVQLLDRDAPEKSPLLTVPSKPHGTMQTPVFADEEDFHYRQLLSWVRQLASSEAPRRPAGPPETVEPKSASLLQPRSSSLGPGPLPEGGGKDGADDSQAAEGTAKAAGDDEGAGERYIPRDPFDPEIFNRRFLGDGDERGEKRGGGEGDGG